MGKNTEHRITDIFYNVNLLEGAIPVEQEDGTFAIKNFTIIKAGLSANRNYYPPDVLRRDLKVFEGVQIRTDHPSPNREASVRDIIGKIVKPRWSESDKAVRGDAIFSSVEKDLMTKVKERLIGDTSINAFGTTLLEKGPDGKTQRRIRALNSANSVDLVCEASAGGTLHEEKRQNSLICERMVETMSKLDNLTEEELDSARPDLVEAILSRKKSSPNATAAGAPDLSKLAESIGEQVNKQLSNWEKKQDEKDVARALTEAIVTAVEETIEESTMVDEAKPLIRKSLLAFAGSTFKQIDAIDRTKLSEERDSMLTHVAEVGTKIAEQKKDDDDGKGGDGKKKDKTKTKTAIDFSI